MRTDDQHTSQTQLSKGNDTLESFLSKVAVESDLRKKDCKNRICYNREILRKKIAKVYIKYVQDSFRKSLLTATFKRKLSTLWTAQESSL